MVDFSLDQVIISAMPVLKTLMWLVIGISICGGLFYWLFVYGKRKKWYINIWERKADGKIHLIGRDVLVERNINKGKQRMYVLKKRKVETFPPPHQSVYRLFNKEYVDYIQIREDYVPLERALEFTDELDWDNKKEFIENVRNKIRKIKTKPIKELEDEYIYLPVSNVLGGKFTHKPMDYDVNMLRIQAIDNRDKIYADKEEWLQKYGYLVAIGGIIVLIIVVLYLSYDYSGNVIEMAMGKSQETLRAIEMLASKMGGGSGVIPAS